MACHPRHVCVGSGHTGIPLYLEAICNHISETIVYMKTNNYRRVQVKEEIFEAFNKELTKKLDRYVWDQCDNWYLQGGNHSVLYPGFVTTFIRDCAAIPPEHFHWM